MSAPDRLGCMLCLRTDGRVRLRIDTSDVLQDTYMEA